jgi:hypothetical protein
MTDRSQTIVDKVNDIHRSESFFHKYIFQIITLIFLAGGGWITLNNVEALAQDNKEQIEEDQEVTRGINEKVIRIETKQEAIENQVEENGDKLDQILEELRKRDRETN